MKNIKKNCFVFCLISILIFNNCSYNISEITYDKIEDVNNSNNHTDIESDESLEYFGNENFNTFDTLEKDNNNTTIDHEISIKKKIIPPNQVIELDNKIRLINVSDNDFKKLQKYFVDQLKSKDVIDFDLLNFDKSKISIINEKTQIQYRITDKKRFYCSINKFLELALNLEEDSIEVTNISIEDDFKCFIYYLLSFISALFILGFIFGTIYILSRSKDSSSKEICLKLLIPFSFLIPPFFLSKYIDKKSRIIDSLLALIAIALVIGAIIGCIALACNESSSDGCSNSNCCNICLNHTHSNNHNCPCIHSCCISCNKNTNSCCNCFIDSYNICYPYPEMIIYIDYNPFYPSICDCCFLPSYQEFKTENKLLKIKENNSFKLEELLKRDTRKTIVLKGDKVLLSFQGLSWKIKR